MQQKKVEKDLTLLVVHVIVIFLSLLLLFTGSVLVIMCGACSVIETTKHAF